MPGGAVERMVSLWAWRVWRRESELGTKWVGGSEVRGWEGV